jgi:hypothetical protein
VADVFSKKYNDSPASFMVRIAMSVTVGRFNENLATPVTFGQINVT